MKANMKLWFATFSALVFSIGLFAGLVLDRTWLLPPPAVEASGPGSGPGRRGPRGGSGSSADVATDVVERLDRDLHLDAKQKQDLRTLLEAWDARMRVSQDAVQQQFRTEQQKLREDVLKLLTAEQVARFKEDGGGRLLPAPLGRGGRGGPGRGR